MRRWQRQRGEAFRRKSADSDRYNPRPRSWDHVVKAWVGFGTAAVTAMGASIGASVNEIVTKGLSFGVVGAAFGALVAGLSGDALNRGRSGIASYRKARKDYLAGTGGPAAVGATVEDIKKDLRLAQDEAQQGIDQYLSARSLVEQAFAVAADAMDGSTHLDAEQSQRGLLAAISAIRGAITVAENGRDGYGKLAEQL